MIYPSYINEHSSLDRFIESCESSLNEIDTMFEDFAMDYLSSKMKQNIDDDITFQTFIESEVNKDSSKNVFEKLGEWIISIITKFAEFVSDLMKKIDEVLWSKKSDAEKIKKIMDKYPHIKDEIKISITKGDIDVRDIKSMQELMNGTYDIVDKINKGKLDETKAESLYNKLVAKYEKYGKPIGAIALTATGVITLYHAVNGILPKTLSVKNEAERTVNTAKMIKINNMLFSENPPLAKRAGEMINKTCILLSQNLSKYGSICKKIGNGITAFQNKFGYDENKLKKEYLDTWKRQEFLNNALNTKPIKKNNV